MSDTEFFVILGVLTKLVILSIIIERGLAFVFEYHWFASLTTIETLGVEGDIVVGPRLQGLKGFIALVVSLTVCYAYDFDIMKVIFDYELEDLEHLGTIITAFVAAGGSSGAIAVFQGFLSFSKQARDANIAAKIAQAEISKELAEFAKKEASVKAELTRIRIEAEIEEVKARKLKIEYEIAEAEAKKLKGQVA